MPTKPITRSLYVSHGGGPLPLLGDDGHKEMVDNLQAIAGQIERPTAILLISAHWEEALPTVTGGANPEVISEPLMTASKITGFAIDPSDERCAVASADGSVTFFSTVVSRRATSSSLITITIGYAGLMPAQVS